MELALAHSRNVCVTKVLQVLMNCDMATPESILGDLVDPDANAAINLAQDRIERRKNHSKRRQSRVGNRCRIHYDAHCKTHRLWTFLQCPFIIAKLMIYSFDESYTTQTDICILISA